MIGVRGHELLQRRIDVEEIDVGDEAIDGGVDARGLGAMHIALRRNEVRQHAKIGKAARIGGVGLVAADALKVVALRVELLAPCASPLRSGSDARAAARR